MPPPHTQVRSGPSAQPAETGSLFRRLLRDRLIRTVLLSVPLIIVVGLLPKRPANMIETGIGQRQLYEMKFNWKAEFDLVLAGNSRVTVGLAPAEMTPALPGLRIANFGFDGNAFAQEYLDAVEGKLRSGAGRRFVMLGITPMTLTERAARQNGFGEERSRPRDERYLARHLPGWLDFFTRFNPRVILLLGSETAREFWRGHPDGWAAQGMDPVDLDGQVRFLRANARDRSFPVSPPMIENLNATVRRWRDAGITTFAFLPPVTSELAREEVRATGFDQAEFVQAFIKAGGHWIEVPAGNYRTFDGGHLEEESARRLSRDLAAEIARRIR